MRRLLVRAAELVAFGAIPLIALVFALWTYSDQGRLALDFHHELYPQAVLVREGAHAFDTPEAYLSDRANLVWPIAAVLPVVPLTVVGAEAADWIATAFVLATLVAALWVLEVRDWRIYGLTLLWPSVIDAYQTANASLPLVLLVAVAWRWRRHAALAGGAIGVGISLKFFLWPLVVWLLACRRIAAAAVACAVALGSLLLMVPFTDIGEYIRVLQKLRRTFEADSYTLFALLGDLGAPEAVARAATTVVGVAVLALAWRRRSLTLAIAAALVLSPIVWRHFFVLLIVPLAIARPRLDVLWLLPLGMWIGHGTFNGQPWQTAGVLAIAAATIVACERTSVRRDTHVRHSRQPAASLS